MDYHAGNLWQIYATAKVLLSRYLGRALDNIQQTSNMVSDVVVRQCGDY